MSISCFISYSRKDSELVDRMAAYLAESGVSCWVDRHDSVAGLDYAASIVCAIKNSSAFILVISRNSLASRFVLNELNSAVSADVPLIPVNIDGSELTDTLEYYIGKTQWLIAEKNSDRWFPDLLNAVRVTTGSREEAGTASPDPSPSGQALREQRRAGSKRKCRMLGFADLIDLGYTLKKIAMKLVENDYICCNGMSDENEGTPDQWEPFLRDESDSFRYLVNGRDEIVGDWSIVALTDESRERALSGDLTEGEFDLATTVKICIPGTYHGYILAITLLPEYRSQENYLLLLDSFFRQLESYAEHGVFFDSWIMNTFSQDVESLIVTLGFKRIAKNRVQGTVYSLEFLPLPELPYIRSFKKLTRYYENHYIQLQTSGSVTIRRYRPEDSTAEVARCLHLTDPYIYPAICASPSDNRWVAYVDASLRHRNSLFSANHLFFAEIEGAIVGICCCIPCGKTFPSSFRTLPICRTEGFKRVKKGYFDPLMEENRSFTGVNVVNLCVLPGFRGRQIGSALLSAVIEEYGTGDIHLDVLSDNAPAIGLYEKYGFRIEGTYTGFGGDGVQCNHMVRKGTAEQQ